MIDKKEFLKHAKQIAAFPENKWVLELFVICDKMGLYPAPANDKPSIRLLNLPSECEKPLLDYTKQNGLLIEVHTKGRYLYSGYFDHIMYNKPPKIEGIDWGATDISIYPAPEGANLDEIFRITEVIP